MANDILPERFVDDTSQLNSLLSLPVTYSHLIRTVLALRGQSTVRGGFSAMIAPCGAIASAGASKNTPVPYWVLAGQYVLPNTRGQYSVQEIRIQGIILSIRMKYRVILANYWNGQGTTQSGRLSWSM